MNSGLKDWILGLGGVTEAPHKLGGTEFRFHNTEFMHTHGPGHLDIRLSKENQTRMLKDGKAEPHRAEYHSKAGWVTLRIRSDKDIETAKELILLAYNNAERQVELNATRAATPTGPKEQRLDS